MICWMFLDDRRDIFFFSPVNIAVNQVVDVLSAAFYLNFIYIQVEEYSC